MTANPPTSQKKLYGNILADAPCVCGVIRGQVVAGFFLGKSLRAKMAISDVQIMAIIHRVIYPKSCNKLDMKYSSFMSLL
jgi:hypothetical protein